MRLTWAGGRLAVALVGMLSAPVTAGADVVLEWNAITLATIQNQNPFAQARFAAIAHGGRLRSTDLARLAD